MIKILKKITKEEWLIAGAVGLLAYFLFTKKRTTKYGASATPKRLTIDDPNITRVQYPTDLEERFKKVAGGAYEPFLLNLKAIGLDKEIAMRQLYTESSFSSNVINCSTVSSAGARGIAQFMPSTWTYYGGGGNACNVSDSLKAYPKLMSDLMKQFPNRIDLVLAGYNWGANRKVLKDAYANNTPYEQYKNGLPSETKKYVASILRP